MQTTRCAQTGWMASTSWCCLLVALLPVVSEAPRAQEQAIGRVKVVSGSAWVVRNGHATPAQLGQPVHVGDRLETRSGGRLGVTLIDETRVALGADSSVSLDEFTFDVTGGRLQVVLQIARGIVAYVSGQIAKLAADSVQLQTPEAIIGVRGTTLAVRLDPS